MEITSEIRNICERIAQVYRDKMSNAGYDPNGELMKFNWVAEYNGNLFELHFNLPDYQQYAENGRRPGKFPPPDAILKWVQFKRLIPRPGRDGKLPSTNQLVYLISRKIALQGTTGKHLLQQTIDGADDLIDQIINEFTKQLQEEINKEEI